MYNTRFCVSQRFVISIILFAILMLLAQPTFASIIIFEDNFDNGAPIDSDNVPGFWSVDVAAGPGGANGVVESGSLLSLTTGDNDGTNDRDYSGVSMVSDMSSEFNPFARQITLSARDINFGNNASGNIWADMRLRFGLMSESKNSYRADDGIVLTASGSSLITLGFKEDLPNGDSDGTTILENIDMRSTDTGNHFRGFDLVLEPGTGINELLYDLTLVGDVSDSTYQGAFTFDVANWNGVDGSSALMIWAQEGNITGGNQYFTANIGSFTVQAVPEPSSVVMLAMALLGLVCLARRRTR